MECSHVVLDHQLDSLATDKRLGTLDWRFQLFRLENLVVVLSKVVVWFVPLAVQLAGLPIASNNDIGLRLSCSIEPLRKQ